MHEKSQIPRLSRSAPPPNERLFHQGSLIFIEGEPGNEMYVIKSGKARMLKEEGTEAIELAILGPGNALGESCLLGGFLYATTAQALEETVVMVIDRSMLYQALLTTPRWFSSVFGLLVQKLQSSIRASRENIVWQNIAGVIRVLLLLPGHKTTHGIRLTEAQRAIDETIGLSRTELEDVFLHLILKGMLVIRKGRSGHEEIVPVEKPALEMYMNFLRSRYRGKQLPGEKISDLACDVVELLIALEDKGDGVKTGTLTGVESFLVEESARKHGISVKQVGSALEELVSRRILAIGPETLSAGETKTGAQPTIFYNSATLRKLCLLKTWLPTFQEKVEH